MGGPRAKTEEERRERLLEAKRRSYRRGLARKRHMAVIANQQDLREESEAMSELWDMNEMATLSKPEPLSNKSQALPLVHSYFSLVGSSRGSPPPSSLFSSDNDDNVDSEYHLSDDESSTCSINASISDVEPEKPEPLSIPATWQYDTIQDEVTFMERLHMYYDEIDGFLEMDVGLLSWVLKSRQAEIADAWCAVEARKAVACQVATLEHMLQRFRVQGWDRTIMQMATTLTAEYRRSSTLAYVHQRQVQHLRAGLDSGEVEHHLLAFKEWWIAALPELHVHRLAKDRFV